MNIAHYLVEQAAAQPHRRAVVVAAGRDDQGHQAYAHLTFAQLHALCDRYARALVSVNVRRGTRTLVMVRPGLDFVPLIFALFKIGAVPVLIDPGMGWRNLVHAAAQVAPEAFIGIPAAHLLRLLAPRQFASVRIRVTLGRRWFWGGSALRTLAEEAGDAAYAMAETRADETAAILFTTGSTGPAKGVVYTHGIFDAQVRLIRQQYGITPADIDLPCFPLFALFSVAMGATAVIPEMDFTRPAKADPRRLVEAITNQGVTYSFGSPALWRPVSGWCAAHDVKLPSLRQVLMAGAPVPDTVHDALLHKVLGPGAQTHTPYGATEALPVCSLTGTEALGDTAPLTRQGAGICVGRPLPGITLRIIKIMEEVVDHWDDALCVAEDEIGEIVVKGPVVTAEYWDLPEATRLAKLREGDEVWHRMGDVGYLDDRGRLWFCGRKNHRVVTEKGTLYTIPCEAVFNQHPAVRRSALVGVGARGRQTPVIVIEPEPGKFPRNQEDREAFSCELEALAASNPRTSEITTFRFHPSFPVDIRHNAKIRREELAVWAARQG